MRVRNMRVMESWRSEEGDVEGTLTTSTSNSAPSPFSSLSLLPHPRLPPTRRRKLTVEEWEVGLKDIST